MNSFDNFFKKELNTPQKKAATKKDGTTIVIAGAGSGKTRVITSRIANLILKENIHPQSIIALTFTNKAANEMKKRLIYFLGTSSHLPFVGTFHSYCLLLLKSNPGLLPFSNFSIIDEDDQKILLKKIIKKNNLEKQITASLLSYQISNTKNRLTEQPEYFTNPMFKEMFLAYESEKAAAHNLDFDDLLLYILKIFQNKSDFKLKFQSKIKHILVDEYQDTNEIQHELLKQMALAKNKKVAIDSICAVGDEDQSIYSWRGAKVTNMLSFQKDFSPVKVIKIEQNYRSVQPILKAANSVIKNNTQRHEKKLWSEKKATNRILSLTCQSGYQEAETIASYIKTLPNTTKLQNIAILYRTHFQSRIIEEFLIRSSIPYKIIGGIRFYERKEIKDILAYLRLIVNPFDRTSLFRIINCPNRGLGPRFEEILYQEWNKNPFLDFKQILKKILQTPEFKIKGKKAESLKSFINIFNTLEKNKTPSASAEHILQKTEYFSFLQNVFDPNEAEIKIENIREFIQSINAFEKSFSSKNSSQQNSLENFLQEIALLQEKLDNNKIESDQVQMMTLHAAKGLEFNTIIITGLEEGLLPSHKSLSSYEALEEERRLFYVGITRAKERLILLCAKCRNSYGQINDQVISRFLLEIPNSLLQSIDLSSLHSSQIKRTLTEWLTGKSQKSKIITFPSHQNHKFLTAKQWKKNQPVSHKKFGIGIIKKIEAKSSDQFYLIIKFKTGEKRILSSFVNIV